MKWLAFSILFCMQAGWVSSCVFDKVENVPGIYYKEMSKDESGCFAACYEDNNCIALAYRKDTGSKIEGSGSCTLFRAAGPDFRQPCLPNDVCYTVQRDEEDSTCARYMKFEKRPKIMPLPYALH